MIYDNKKTILISVIMSVYNENEEYLIKSIGSILNQKFKDFEFIIVNDGSDEKTVSILDSFRSKDNRIKIIDNPKNLGLTKSLNNAIKNSQGAFIARMDSDDISLPNRLEKQLEFLQKNNFDLIDSDCDIIDNKENVLKEKRTFLPKNLKRAMIKGNFFTHSAFFGKKIVFDELYNENFKRAQDYEFLLRILGKGYQLGHMRENVLKYRMHNEGISSKNSKEQEFFALKARFLAIKNYGYSLIYSIYILRAFLSFLLPYKLKHFIIYKMKK